MGQTSIYQEPLPIRLGGLNLPLAPGVLITNHLGTSVQPTAGSDNTVLRSNGTGWNFGISGKVIQTGISTYSTPLVLTSPIFLPSGLTITMSPYRSDSAIAVIVRINGLVKTAAGGVLYLRLMRDSTVIRNFGFPGLYAPGGATSLAIGSATTTAIILPGSTSSMTLSVAAMNQSGIGNVLLHWGDNKQITTVSSIMFFEVLTA